MIRGVFDTNIFLRALINPHSRCGRLLGEFASDYELILSAAILREVLEVSNRPRLRARFPRMAQMNVDRLIAIFERAEVVEPSEIEPLSRDPKDDIFLACSRAARAGYLVTEDNDLLVLGSYHNTRICRPDEFIAYLEHIGRTNPQV